MTGKLRKPELVRETVGGTAAGGGRYVDRVVRIAIEPDGQPNVRVFADRADLTWDPPENFPYGGEGYVKNPPRVTFDLVDGKAKNVRLV